MSQSDKIIELLLDRFPRYITNFEANNICFRYGGRIHELRKKGWQIENVQSKDNRQEWRAWLESPIRLEEPYTPKYKAEKQNTLL
jgi:hypothetical protein